MPELAHGCSHDKASLAHDHAHDYFHVLSVMTAETKAKLASCWETDVNWQLYPLKLKEVSQNPMLASLYLVSLYIVVCSDVDMCLK